jgi:divalent metal cation (Fe/Co/Zn/Cd) transporter
VIGIILTVVSLVLTKESWSLLMGETISPEALERIIVIVESNTAVEQMRNPMSMFLSPEEALLILKPKVKKNLTSTEVIEAIKSIRNSISREFPKIKQVFIEPV